MGFKSLKIFWGASMTKNCKYYVDKYLKTLSKICFSPSDYSDPKFSTRVHNRAIDQFNLLEVVIEENLELANEVYSELMEINDIKVKFYASAYCLKLNINVERAEEILEHIRKTGEKWIALYAERNLKIWRGEIDPDDPG